MTHKEPGIDFDRGELVRLRMEPQLVGQVIGEKDWGSTFLVRLGGSTEAYWFENIELETYVPDGANAGFGHDDEPPKSMNRKVKDAAIDNVIKLADRRHAGGGVH